MAKEILFLNGPLLTQEEKREAKAKEIVDREFQEHLHYVEGYVEGCEADEQKPKAEFFLENPFVSSLELLDEGERTAFLDTSIANDETKARESNQQS